MMHLSGPSRPKRPNRHTRLSTTALALGILLSACARTPVVPPAPGPETAPPVRAAEQDRDLQSVINLMTAGRYKEAIEPIRRLIAAHPEQAELYANLGVAYARVKRFEDAEKAFKAALARHFEHAELYNQLGIVYRQMGRFNDAEQAYMNALRLDPKHANAELNLGILLELYMQDPERALPHFQAYEALRSNDKEVSKWIKDIERRKRDGEL